MQQFEVMPLQAAEGSVDTATVAATAAVPSASGNGQFGEIVTHGLESLNAALQRSDAGLQDLAVGGTASLHQVMIQMQEAKISLQLAVQIRNQILSAYQDVMRMSI